MSYAFMYWFTRLDVLQETFTVMAIVAGVVLLFGAIVVTVEGNWDRYKKAAFIITPIWLFFACGAVLIPTQKEAAAIFLIPKMVNNEQVLNIASGSLSVVELKMKEWISDLTEKAAGE